MYAGFETMMHHELKTRNKFDLRKNKVTDIILYVRPLTLVPCFDLFYAIQVVQVESAKNTTTPQYTHTRDYSNMN